MKNNTTTNMKKAIAKSVLSIFLIICACSYNASDKITSEMYCPNSIIDSSNETKTGYDSDSCFSQFNGESPTISAEENDFDARVNEYLGKNIIAMNHDDLRPQDYENTWRIYQKYGFSANFNLVLMPFGSVYEKEIMAKNVREMLDAGNTLGLHAIMGRSYFWVNKLFDLRPDNTFTYAPTISEISTDIGNGKNIFGYEINSKKTLTQLGFISAPDPYSSLEISSISAHDYVEIMKFYNLYWNSEKIFGLDLNDEERIWTPIHWLEYWYNELIDGSLGYSSMSFENDYSYPDGNTIDIFYPDEKHLQNGKVVFYGDINNPNYNNPDYQKVGRFKCGLFKDCSTCLNYEVEDRCFLVAKAFCDYYFKTNKLTVYGRHGSGFVDCYWNEENTPYDNRSKTIISGEFGRFFFTRKSKFISQKQILIDAGIKMTTHFTPLEAIYESQIGLYYGQGGIRSPFFNHVTRTYGGIGYLNIIDTSPSYSGSYVDEMLVKQSIKGETDILKYAYENSGCQISNGLYVTPYLKMFLDAIRSCAGTGKIPSFSLDTLVDDFSTNIAIEAICEFCSQNDFVIVPMEIARQVAHSISRVEQDNFFPNPTFEQSLLNRFGDSTNSEACIPDGWLPKKEMYFGCETSFDVSDYQGSKKFSIIASGNGYAFLETRMFGLTHGRYVLSFTGKSNRDDSSYLMIFKQKNCDLINKTDYYSKISFSNEFEPYNISITIEKPLVVETNSSVSNQYSDGYENNISNIRVLLGISNPYSIVDEPIVLTIHSVTMRKVSE